MSFLVIEILLSIDLQLLNNVLIRTKFMSDYRLVEPKNVRLGEK